MQITIDAIALLGTKPEEGAQNFRMVPKSLVQKSQAIGAASIVQFLRGNKEITWTFTVQMVHATAEAAIYYCTTQEKLFPYQGKLTVVTDPGESVYASATVEVTDLTFEGASTKVGYKVVSGAANGGTGSGPQEFVATATASPTLW